MQSSWAIVLQYEVKTQVSNSFLSDGPALKPPHKRQTRRADIRWNFGEVECSQRGLTEMASCPDINEQHQNETEIASDVIAACGSGLFYIIIFFLSILGVCLRPFVTLSSSHGTFIVFLIGAIVACVNVFTNSDNLKVKLYFRIPVTIIIGIAYTVFGALCFFSRPRQQTNEATLGRQ